MARSSSGLGRLILNQQIMGSNPIRATKFKLFGAARSAAHGSSALPRAFWWVRRRFGNKQQRKRAPCDKRRKIHILLCPNVQKEWCFGFHAFSCLVFHITTDILSEHEPCPLALILFVCAQVHRCGGQANTLHRRTIS